MSGQASLTDTVKALALEAGFARVGIAPADADLKAEPFEQWLAAGHHGEMTYLARDVAQRHRPVALVEAALSVICLAVGYAPAEELPTDAFIARYARGRDYHKLLKKRAHHLMDRLREIEPSFDGRAFVDAGPVAERSLAAAAGLGWIGKNGCLVVPDLGSYVVLCEIVCNLPLQADQPLTPQCGDCNACVRACPTRALLGDGLMDARRCRSYLTIEHRDAIPDDLQPLMGNCLFGCDDCQAVCPHNKDVPAGDPELSQPRDGLRELSINRVRKWTEPDWDAATRGSGLRRATLEMFHRNAAVIGR